MRANLDVLRTRTTLCLAATGEWNVFALRPIDQAMHKLDLKGAQEVRVETSKLVSVDTAGAWIIFRFLRQCRAAQVSVETPGLHPTLQKLFERFPQEDTVSTSGHQRGNRILESIARLGEGACKMAAGARDLIGLLGATVTRGAWSAIRLKFAFKSMVSHVEHTGIRALPIVGTISFLIGIVLIYQSVFQFQRFGAEIFAIDMLAISLAREISILLTAIIVAGRSGSAFAAQLGTMKLNQEVDALQVLGMDPVDVLVVPRVAALMISLPLLAFYALLMGLLGGALMCYLTLNVGFFQYFEHVKQALSLHSFLVGLVKAPFFACIIALIGCFEGLRVKGGAASVGQNTTRAVVKGIFAVIILDAIFSIAFTAMGI